MPTQPKKFQDLARSKWLATSGITDLQTAANKLSMPNQPTSGGVKKFRIELKKFLMLTPDADLPTGANMPWPASLPSAKKPSSNKTTTTSGKKKTKGTAGNRPTGGNRSGINWIPWIILIGFIVLLATILGWTAITGCPSCLAAAATPPSITNPGGAPALPGSGSVSSYVALNYDESNADALIAGQSRLIALYLRDAEAAGTTQAAMEAAIQAIQAEAAASNATVIQGPTLQLDQNQAWLVWCSDASSADIPTDVSLVFDKLPQGPGRVWIQVPFAAGVPLRSKDTFSGCGGTFWAVSVK